MGLFVDPSGFPDVGNVGGGSARDMVTTRFDLAEAYASDSYAMAKGYVSSLSSLLASLSYPNVEALEEIAIPEILPIDYQSRPKLGDPIIDFEGINTVLPTIGQIDGIGTVDGNAIPSENLDFREVTISRPTINYPTAPSSNVSLNSVEAPAKPDYEMPDKLIPREITIPDAPVIQTITFDVDAPVLEALDHPEPFTWEEAPYNSDIYTSLFQKVLNDIVNGGTGLSPSIEADIMQRFRLRNQVENDRLYQQVSAVHGPSGFNLPSGAFAAQVSEVLGEISRKLELQSLEIMIAQANLAQQNTQFAITTGVELEKVLREFHNNQSNRSLEKSRLIAGMGVEIFNALVNRYNTMGEVYKAQAAAFESRIRAELVKAEIYKAQIEGAKTEGQLEETKAKIYEIQMGSIEVLTRIYATEVQAAKDKMAMELSKIEVLKAQTELYAAKIEGEKLKGQIYRDQLEGERTRSMVFESMVKAYSQKVVAAQAKINAQVSTEDLKLRKNQQTLDKYRVELDGYRALLETELKASAMNLDGFNAEVSAYNAETEAFKAQNYARLQDAQNQIAKARLQMERAVAEIEAITKGYVAVKELQVKGTEGIMQVGAQLAAGAMNSVNAQAQFSYHGSESMSESTSHSESLSESHPYIPI